MPEKQNTQKKNMMLLVWIVLMALIMYIIANPGAIPFPGDNKICCKSFEFGTYGEEVNYQYEKTTPGKCIVPEDFTDGGKTSVDPVNCE